jgi:hypothetical protein
VTADAVLPTSSGACRPQLATLATPRKRNDKLKPDSRGRRTKALCMVSLLWLLFVSWLASLSP